MVVERLYRCTRNLVAPPIGERQAGAGGAAIGAQLHIRRRVVAPVYRVGTVRRRGGGESHIVDVDGRYLRAHEPRFSRKTRHSGRRVA